MDSQIVAALIGAGATVAAAVITIVLTRRGTSTTGRSRRASSELQEREPSVVVQRLRDWMHRFFDDPFSATITLAIYVAMVGALAYGAYVTVKALWR